MTHRFTPDSKLGWKTKRDRRRQQRQQAREERVGRMSVNDILHRGFDAGNYANAYVSENYATAWRKVKKETHNQGLASKPAFKAAFIIGFFSSYETSEVGSLAEKLIEAENEYGNAMRNIGIAVDSRSWDELA